MPEYINKENLISAIVNTVSAATETTHDFLVGSAYRQNEIIDIVKEQPAADVVEVVRCKNCELFKPYSDPLKGFYGECMVRESDIGENDFCSYGKRKEGVKSDL